MRFTKRAKRAAAAAAGSALLAGVLAACGSPAPSVSSSGSAGSGLPPNSASRNLKGVTLTVWESNSLTPGYKALFTAFEKATGAKIDPVVFPDPFESNLMTKWATGARPDLMIFQSAVDWIQQVNPAKNLFDLTSQPYVAKELFHQNQYASVVDGKDYGLSLETPSVFGLWYNKQILAKDGLSAPTDFTQLVSACKTIKKDNPGVSPLYDAGGDQWPTQVLPFMLWTDSMKAGLQTRAEHQQGAVDEPVDRPVAHRLPDADQGRLLQQQPVDRDLRPRGNAIRDRQDGDDPAGQLGQPGPG